MLCRRRWWFNNLEWHTFLVHFCIHGKAEEEKSENHAERSDHMAVWMQRCSDIIVHLRVAVALDDGKLQLE